MTNQASVLAIIFVPVVGSLFLPFAGMLSERLRDIAALILVSVSLILTIMLIPVVASGGIVSLAVHFPLSIDLAFTADGLAVFMALVTLLTGLVIVLYSFDYISHYDNRNEYYLMVVLFIGAMMGIVFSSNLIFLFVFWEITGIVSWRLIGFFRGVGDVLRADKSFLVTVFGALLMLLGFIAIYNVSGSFNLPVIKEFFRVNSISNVVVALVLCGILSKSATLPFHTWLPDAGVAPSPVTALLHAAVLVKIGVYVFARLFIATIPIGQVWHTIVPVVALVSALTSAGAALIDTDLKRIIAYSTISQIGFIFFGLATGNIIGVAGGLLYILMHGIAKAGLFLCAGIVEQNAKTKDITKMGGLMKTMPFTAIAFLFCSFSVMGVPPFGGFFSKFMVFSGSINNGQYLISASFLFGAILTIVYLFRVFNMVFLGDARVPAKEGSPLMVGSVVSLAVLSLLAGVLIAYPAAFAQFSAGQMLGLLK